MKKKIYTISSEKLGEIFFNFEDEDKLCGTEEAAKLFINLIGDKELTVEQLLKDFNKRL